MKSLHIKTPQEWRTWLQSNHDKEREVWLIFLKKDTRKPSLDYESAVEEALCFGWIDSIIKKIDELKFARKFTPRKDNSKWSAINKNQKQFIGWIRVAKRQDTIEKRISESIQLLEKGKSSV